MIYETFYINAVIKGFIRNVTNKLHVHVFKYHHDTGFNIYYKCKCGKRKVYKPFGGYQPVDNKWLKEGAV